MKHLDSDPTVVTWSYEQVVIEYVSNIRTKKTRRYYPDFLVTFSDGRVELLEVKPRRKLMQQTVKKKAAAAVEWCREKNVTYRMLTEIELKGDRVVLDPPAYVDQCEIVTTSSGS